MEIITINVGFNDSEKKAGHFVKEHAIKYPVIFDADSEITMNNKVTGVPTVIIADSSGTIVFRQYYVPNQDEIYKLLWQ